MFIPSTFKRPVSSWKALNLRKTLLMASSVRLKPLNCSRLPCVYAQETLTFLLTQKKTCVKNYVQKEYDGIITTIMATIQRINIIGSREGSRNRRRLKANQTGKKFRVGIKSNISTNRNNL